MASKQDVIQFGTNAVYEGFWQNRDRGKILGATLTLRDSRAIPLVAALAIIVGLVGNRSWHISRLTWHTLLSTKDGDTKAAKERRRKEQVILRNSETAGGAIIGFVETFFEIGFLRAIKESTLKDILVLPTCGVWFPDPALNFSESDQIYRELMVNLTIDADNYVRSCYPEGGSQGILECNKFISRSFSSRTEEKVACPFQRTACLPDAQSAVILESENITLSQLGFNTKYGKELSIHRRSTCAVLNATYFRNFTSEEARVDPNNTRYYSFYRDNSTQDNDVDLQFNGLQNTMSESYRLIHFYLPFPEILQPALLPKPLHDTSLLLMQHLGILYRDPSDDPWFFAHRPIDRFGNDTSQRLNATEFYLASYFLNVIACDEQLRICSSITQQCTEFQGLLNRKTLNAENYTALIGPNDYKGNSTPRDFSLVMTLLEMIMQYTAIPWSIAGRGGDVLQANRFLQDGFQNGIPKTQWITEMEHWFRVSLTRLQLSVFNTIERPPNQDPTRLQNFWTRDDIGNVLSYLCGRIKFNSPHHTSLSTFGLTTILVFSGVLLLGSMLALCLPAIAFFNRRGPIRDWKRDDALALLAKTDEEGVSEIGDLEVEYTFIGVEGKTSPPPLRRENTYRDPFEVFS